MEERNQYTSPEYDGFKQKLRKIIGLNLNSYKNQIHYNIN